jgi:hypothetical protein
MAAEEVPAWKYWHPLSIWLVLAIFAVAQIVFQIGFAGIFSLLGMAGGTGATVGAGAGGMLGFAIVWKMAQKARAK